MDAAVKVLVGGDRNGVRHKLNARPEYYGIESEVSNRITYVCKDGDFALCYGLTTVILRDDVAEELRDVLNDVVGNV